MTIENIAVGYDGSPDAAIAVRWALGAAGETGATVTIVHATGLLEHLHERFTPDRLPTALLALTEECEFAGSSTTEIRAQYSYAWVRHQSTLTCWSWVHAAKESVSDFSWAVRVSKSSSTPPCRSSSCRRAASNSEHVGRSDNVSVGPALKANTTKTRTTERHVPVVR
jgi:hypothetical protein